MVLERLFPEELLERKFIYAFILGFAYSIIGIIIARLLFPANSGIVSVIFTSILLSPYMRKIFAKEEASEEKERKFTLKELYSLDYDVIFMYFLIFFGIFLSYLIFSFILPQLGVNTFNILREQLFLDPSLRGRAAFDFGSFNSIFYSNWWVLLATFMLALIAGDGAVFFITWNASAWGVIFGFRALSAANYSGQHPLYMLVLLVFIVIWHIILESGAYILAGIAGSTISHEIIKERIEIKEFVLWLLAGMGLFLFFRYALSFSKLSVLSRFVIYFLLAVVLIIILGKIVAEKKNKEVFTYNLALLIIAILVFAAGAVVETAVLSNSSALNDIYTLANCEANSISEDDCQSALNSWKDIT